MTERLQKILSGRGVASRRAAEKMITDGRVTVNGRIALIGESADPEKDEILLDGSLLPSVSENVYILLNKPRGYVTTVSDDRGRKTVMELVQDCPARVYPVGRLDMDSEGLLLMTNDGAFANALMHPRHNVNKAYEVWVTGYHNAALALLARPITLDGYTIRKPEVKLLWEENGKAKLIVTIHEGRNRQIRRMCEAAQMRVTRLRRISEGCLKLGDLPLGKWRYLTKEEIANL
jgi:23S rRNA pseudouridine2605 synthase